MEVKSAVRSFLVRNYHMNKGVAALKDDDSLLGKGILDSTAVLELLEFLEETFSVRIEDSEVVPENLDSLDRIDSFIKRKTLN
jgi:acyl carrier protein